MRRRRWRWVGVGIVVAVGLFVVFDIVSVQYIESRGAAEIARTMSAESATVDLGGFPFIPRFLGGRLTNTSVLVRGASATGGLRVDSVEARMLEVRFKPGAVFALARSSFATRTDVMGIDPFGIVEIAEEDLEDYVMRAAPLVGDVEIKGSGIEVFFKRRVDTDLPDEVGEALDELTNRPARYLPVIENGRLVLSLVSFAQIDQRFRGDASRLEGIVDLPKIPSGLRTSVTWRDGVIVMEAQGPKVTLTVGEGEPQAVGWTTANARSAEQARSR
jgi:hypothetical protein